MQISLMIEGQAGLTWARWKEIVARVQDWGFAGLYRSDHFTMASPPPINSLEMIVSLTYVADHASSLNFGPLVAPFSFRDPVMLARQAAALNELSGGRMILGVGAGWQEHEHQMFGYPLGDTRTRMERFAEGLQVVTRLLNDDAPVSFHGKFYTLNDAQILPRPKHTRILVGGNGRTKTLPLAAHYADVWNGVQLSPDQFRELSGVLDQELQAIGRDPQSVKRTTSSFLFWGENQASATRRLRNLARWNREWSAMSDAEILDLARHWGNALVGVYDELVPMIRAYADAGVEELMLQTIESDDVQGLTEFANKVLPRLS